MKYLRAQRIGRTVLFAAGIVLCAALIWVALPFAWSTYFVWAITAIQDSQIIDMNAGFDFGVELGSRIGAVVGALVGGLLFIVVLIAVVAGAPISAIVATVFGIRQGVRRLRVMYDGYRIRQYFK